MFAVLVLPMVILTQILYIYIVKILKLLLVIPIVKVHRDTQFKILKNINPYPANVEYRVSS